MAPKSKAAAQPPVKLSDMLNLDGQIQRRQEKTAEFVQLNRAGIILIDTLGQPDVQFNVGGPQGVNLHGQLARDILGKGLELIEAKKKAVEVELGELGVAIDKAGVEKAEAMAGKVPANRKARRAAKKAKKRRR